MMEYTKTIKEQAVALGFNLVGVTTARPLEDDQRHFVQWLNKGNAAGMGYLRHNIEKRFAPAQLLDGAKSVLCVALNYEPSQGVSDGPCRIADFALYEDYHEFIRQRLKTLADFITQSAHEKNIQFKICVDSVPLAERALAQRAGLGWIGKNKSLIHPTLGCQLLLGELITTLELTPDEPFKKDLCGNCDQCLRACPSGALSDDGEFDSRKCISYLTIEHKGDIPQEMADKIGNRLFGCDQCVLTCPYQQKAPACSNKDFQFFLQRTALLPQDILDWTQEDFDKHFKNSSLERLGLERLKRNAHICCRNTNRLSD
jgi:epoxyqueuosine reductase